MNEEKLNELLIAISAYKDCIKWNKKENFCYNCAITGSGVPIPLDICDLTDEERDQKIDDVLQELWDAYQNGELRLSAPTTKKGVS